MGSGRPGSNAEWGRPRLWWIAQSRIVICRWRSLKGIKKSRHSRRRLPPSRSHTEFAFGARTGVRRTRTRMVKKLDLFESDHGCGLNGLSWESIPKRKQHNVTRSAIDV